MTDQRATSLRDSDDGLTGFPVIITLPVQWGEQDALGHVNNIVYFRWFESARIEYLRRLGVTAEGSEETTGVIVAAISCDFRRPVTYPDTVLVGARVTRIGKSSMTMEHAVYSEAQQAVAAEGTSTIVAFDYRANQSQPVPDAVREAIDRLEKEGSGFRVQGSETAGSRVQSEK